MSSVQAYPGLRPPNSGCSHVPMPRESDEATRSSRTITTRLAKLQLQGLSTNGLLILYTASQASQSHSRHHINQNSSLLSSHNKCTRLLLPNVGYKLVESLGKTVQLSRWLQPCRQNLCRPRGEGAGGGRTSLLSQHVWFSTTM